MSEAVDLKKIGIALNSVVADRKSIDKTVAEIEKSLDAAAGDVDDIELAENRLRSLEKVIAKAIVKAQGVMGLLREAETDEAFVAAKGAQMAPLVDLGSKQLKAITAQFGKVKELEKRALKDRSSSSNVIERARQSLARLVDRVANDRSDLKGTAAKADLALQHAAFAVDQRDVAGLKKGQSEFAATGVDVNLNLHAGVLKDIDAFEKDAKDKELVSLAGELKDGIADLRGDLKANETYVEVLQRQSKVLADLAIAPANVAKAAKLLAADRDVEKQLETILKLDLKQMEAKLNPIGAKLKKKLSGKAIIALLRQNDVI